MNLKEELYQYFEEANINITENGFHVTAKRGNDFTKYITDRYRS